MLQATLATYTLSFTVMPSCRASALMLEPLFLIAIYCVPLLFHDFFLQVDWYLHIMDFLWFRSFILLEDKKHTDCERHFEIVDLFL